MQRFSDEKLVEMYKNGNHEALALLIVRYIDVINIKLRSYKLLECDFEDAQQEILISFLNVVNTFDKTKNVKFKTYANRCLDNAVKNYLNKIFTKKSIVDKSVLKLDEDIDVGNLLTNNQNPENIYEDKVLYNELLEKIQLELSEFEKNVLFYHLDGKSYFEISTLVNSTQKAVDNALQRVRRKLKTVLKDN